MSKARWRKARWVGLAVYCCVALLAATSCGSDDDDDGSAGGGTTTTASTEAHGRTTQEIGEPGGGQVNLINWAGYVEKDVGHALRDGDRLQGQLEGRRDLGRDGRRS